MLRFLAVAIFLGCAAWAQDPAAPDVPASIIASSMSAEKQVVLEMSNARLHPKEFAKWLRTQLGNFEGALWNRPDHQAIQTQEGAAAVEELIRFLEKSPSIGPLRWSEGLSRAAQDFVNEQGPTGQTGHVGPSGSNLQSRMLKHGLHQSMMGEVINYGAESPRWTVAELLIDDGIANRGHRKIIFDPDFHVAGAAIGPHAVYGEMTVVDFADAFQENP